MNEREKLIELINQVRGNEVALANYEADIIIDHLLANGIIVPPFAVGAKVAVIASKTSNDRNLYIFEDTITQYRICDGYTVMCFGFHLSVPQWNWDKVYVSREDAEKALKGVE